LNEFENQSKSKQNQQELEIQQAESFTNAAVNVNAADQQQSTTADTSTSNNSEDFLKENIIDLINSIDQEMNANNSKVATSDQESINNQQNTYPIKPNVQQLDKKLLDTAATKIQSTFRGYKTRKNLQKGKANLSNNTKSTSSIDKSCLGESLDPNKQLSSSAQSLDQAANINNNNNTNKKNNNNSKNRKRLNSNNSGQHSVNSKKNQSINDPELAAIKIQSTFRGYKTRKQLENENKLKSSKPKSKNNNTQSSGSHNNRKSDEKCEIKKKRKNLIMLLLNVL
jgi:hypothetical protein